MGQPIVKVPDPLTLLKTGPEKWKEYRDSKDRHISSPRDARLYGIDLRSADLRGVDLRNAELRGVNLCNADLRDVDLSGAELSFALLNDAKLDKADLSRAQLHGAELMGAQLSKAKIRNAHLCYANLSEATINDTDLRDADLREATLIRAHLCGANLSKASLIDADLREANLSEANLRHAMLDEAILSYANLKKADLNYANFSESILYRADLSEARLYRAILESADLCSTKLIGAQLNYTNFCGANLSGANLRNAKLIRTVLGNVNLTGATNLETCRFSGPCTIDHRTVERSGRMPEVFLRGCGVPDVMIDFFPSLLNQPISFFSCFISYSHEDKLFARRLHDGLQGRGIRCWLDEKKVLAGEDIYDAVNQGIKIWDKVLLCASKKSLDSWWVENEINQAFIKERKLRKERGHKVLSLIPLNLDGELFEWDNGLAPDIQRRLAPDFTGWETDNARFERAFSQVVEALQTERDPTPYPKL